MAFAAPHFVKEHELHISLSIGISIYPADGNTVDGLLQNADAAMYHAKNSGRNNCQFFKAEMNTRAVQRLFVEASLRRALKQEEFILHYQPKIDLTSGAIIGAEALIRWKDPKHGLIYPTQFIAIAEECGLIVPIGRWVLREACTQIQRWILAGLPAVPVAVNISAVELKHPHFLTGVAQILKDTDLPPQFLEMELTESILMHDAERSITILESLKSMGIQLAIDDFGTGYSSLSYLRRFPVDTLKIDQSFVREIDTDTSNATIVSAVIGMGRNLKQRVIAEGVETAEQYLFLRKQQCDEGQGFHFSYPLPADDFAYLLENRLTQISARNLW
jgi:EAL domain-containing protein (putative c-di-GMP-specific phosphodiesterase class I)